MCDGRAYNDTKAKEVSQLNAYIIIMIASVVIIALSFAVMCVCSAIADISYVINRGADSGQGIGEESNDE